MDDFFPPDPIIPSSVVDKRWIYARSLDFYDNIGSSLIDNQQVGKWMIFRDCLELSPARGMTRHDYAWQFIKKLVESNCSNVSGLISAKCSTSYFRSSHYDPRDPNGLICCYTNDFNDKHLAKKAADAIRKVYHYPRDMLYKTDQDTRAGKYLSLGSNYVSIYKHTTANQMLERDLVRPYIWNLVRV